MSDQPTSTLNLVEAYSQLEPEYLLICTFTLSLGYIEQKFLNTFKEKHNTRILIVSSATGVSQSFDDFYAVRGVGTHYILAKVEDAPYAFHPKILLALDKKRGPLMYVSGCNFTYPGMSQNLDAVECIELSHANKMTLDNLNSYLQELSDLVISSEQKKIISTIIQNLPREAINESPATFIHNMQNPIFQQILDIVDAEIEEIKIISPYYDERMTALSKFAHLPGNPKCSILCNKNDPHVNLALLPGSITVYSVSDETLDRYLHAKVYIFKTNSKYYSAVGSANCTSPGMLKTPLKEGNWETMVLREISGETAEMFFESFSPKEVSAESHWKYTPLEKKDREHSLLSFEAITHPGMLELQFPHRLHLNSIDGAIHLKFVTGEQESFPFKNVSPNSQGSFMVEIDSTINNVGDRPLLIELTLTEPIHAQGASWAIQKAILSRSKSTQKLMEKLDSLQNDGDYGWSQFDTVMTFITGNLGYLSANKRRPSKKSPSTENTNLVHTIDGVFELDQEVAVAGHNNMTIADLMHSGNRVGNLLESGFLVVEGEDDESDELDSAITSKRGRGKKADRETKPRSDKKIPEYEIPDLRMTFQDQIIKKYNKRIEQLSSEEVEEDFASIISSLVFCLKLARFIHVELTHKFPKYNRDPQQLFSVIAPILNEIPRWVERSKEMLDLSDEDIIDNLEGSEFLQEFALNVCEIWVEDRMDVINYSQKVQLIHILKSYWSVQRIKASVHSLLNTSSRFEPGRITLIMDPNGIDEVIDSLWSADDNLRKYASLYRMFRKIKFFQQARDHHQKAFDVMQKRHSQSKELMSMHKYRASSASEFIKLASSKIEAEIGPGIVQQYFDQIERDSHTPMHLEGISMCPKCSNKLSHSAWLRFRSGIHILCQNCTALMLPVEDYQEYNSQVVTDQVWEDELK